MAGKKFKVREELPRIAALTTKELKREQIIEATLEILIDMGFDRARYYDAAYDFAKGKHVVVLTTQIPEEQETSLLGELFDYETSQLEMTGEAPMPAVGEPAKSPDQDPHWVAQLGLCEKVWVEIPVLAANSRLGVLAGDWSGELTDLGQDDLEALAMAGTQLGSHLGLKPIATLKRYRDREEGPGEHSLEAMVVDSARHLAGILNVAATAVFSFSWPHQTLTKIDEYIASPYAAKLSRLGHLEERYAVGEYLTGSAWDGDQVRHVVSFDSLDEQERDLVAPESRSWHADLLGKVQSVMYTFVGGLDRRYLIRFINRAERPELPFLSELSILDAVVPDLRSDVDTAIAIQRSRSFEDLARLTAQVANPKELISPVAEALRTEAVDNFAVVCHQEESAQYGFSAFGGRNLTSEPLSREAEWQDDQLYAQAVETQQHRTWRLAEYRGGLADRFAEAGFKSVLTLPLSAGQTRGVFFVPMRTVVRGKSRTLPKDCTFGTVSLLHAYSRLIANSVETSHSHAKANGARRALGSMGHELRTPLSALQSETELSINTAKRAIRSIALEPKHRVILMGQIARSEEKASERWREVDAALRLSPIVAKESANKLQVHFERTRVSKVVERAIEEILRALREQKEDDGRRYGFTIAESCERLGSVVCDRIYLRHVVRNLLQNAVNYSNPRHGRRGGQRPEPMMIEVFGERQQNWAAIKVRNWGYGIPEEKRDVIFEPWVRGDISDSKKAIRGMGLGLFLARRILSAHGGRIVFYSEPTLNDPARLKRNEGYETTFEVRIPNNLEEGTFMHEWVDYRSQPLVEVRD
jgi:signal transduction histidine kinase